MHRSTLMQAIETAYAWGKANLDLSECHYGKPHWGGQFVDSPLPYYFFLAGLVAQLQCSRILEIGTHFGGSIFAIERGVQYSHLIHRAEIVTVDVRDNNNLAFQSKRSVKQILGNCLDLYVAREAAASFTAPVDLLFVDTIHEYSHTRKCLDMYVPLALPSLVILDDIHLNDSMAVLWRELVSAYGNRAIDITLDSHREQDVGFGLLICRPDGEQNPVAAT